MTSTTPHPQAQAAVTPGRLDALLADESVPVVHRALWALLWESDVRVLDLLALDVADLRSPDRRPAHSARAAALLDRLADGRAAGPLFAVGDRALTWEQAVRTAADHGHPIHAFRTGGKHHRR
jgi:hypothetical protein